MNSTWIDGSMVTDSGVACVATGKQNPEADGPLLVIACTRGMRSQIVQRAAPGRPD